MRIRTTHRRVVSSSALVAASLLSAQFASAQNSPSITLDLRVDGTGGKTAVVQNVGDRVIFDLYATAHGLDGDDSNDGIDIITTGFHSTTGGLRGDLLGLRPPAPFDGDGWSAGAQTDLDGDGDLDIGPVPGTPPYISPNWYALREAPVDSYHQPPEGYFVGQLMFTVSSLAEQSTSINAFKRPSNEAVLLFIDNNKGVYIKPANVLLGSDVTIQRSPSGGSGPVHYVDGTYDTHLSITDNTAVTPGETLVLSKGFDLSSNGAFDAATGDGTLFEINDDESGNRGGSLLGQMMRIATTSDGSFAQAGGYSRFGNIDVGNLAGHTGSLSITGGTIDAGSVTVGAGGAGVLQQSDGTGTFASLQVTDGSSGTFSGGNLLVAGSAQVGNGGTAALTASGGELAINGDLLLGPRAGEHGFVVISSGSISANRTFAGSIDGFGSAFGTGAITQTGGHFSPGVFAIGSISEGGHSEYQLAAGSVRANAIALSGGGTVIQSGGDVLVTGTVSVERDRIGFSQASQYFISGGSLDIEQGMTVDRTNTMPLPQSGHAGGVVQTGGTVTIGDLHIGTGGTYEARGGTLNLTRGLLLNGTLDFGAQTVTANFGTNTFADFSQGELLGTENATFTGGPGSLLNFAPGFDPYARIGHITTQGLIHINGQPLTIPSDRSVGGSGTIQGNVTNQGLLAPGNSPGEIDIAGDYVQASDAQLSMEIAGTSSDEFDLLSVTGDVHLGGSLSVALLDGFVPSPEDRFTIINAGDLSGIFSNAVDSIDFPSGRFDVLYSPTSVTLTDFQQVPEPVGAGLLAMVGSVAIARRRRRRT